MTTLAKLRRALYRSRDGELIGYVERRGDAWLALSVFGIPLATCGSEQEAETWLEGRGLAALAETWQFFDEELGDWFACHLEEASPEAVSLRVIDYRHPRAYARSRLTAPDEARLRYR